jgi:hypothetical protein
MAETHCVHALHKSAGYYEAYSTVFVELNRSKRATSITIEFLVWSKSRPSRKRWIPVTSSVREQIIMQKLDTKPGS